MKEKVSLPRCILKWNELSSISYNWHTIFILPYAAVRDSKIHYFQFRFVHRILSTNSFLYKIKKSDSPLCSFCGNEEESLDHLFWLCSHVKNFWYESIPLCLKEPFGITLEHVKFGFTDDPEHLINFFILHSKYFIFNCKMNNKIPNALSFYCKFQFCMEVEDFILTKMGNEVRLLKMKEFFRT